MSRRLLLAILIGGAAAGLLDIPAAALINRIGLDVVLRFIASGLLGPSAMQGGAGVVALGAALQVAMSVLIAAIYAVAALRLPVLARRWVTFGLLYGVGVFVVMNYVVLPLSAAPLGADSPSLEVMGLNMLAMLAFGLIVAFAVRQGLRGRRSRRRL